MKKDNILFTIGGIIFSICMILFTVGLVFETPDMQSDPTEDWVGILFCVLFFVGVVLFLIGAIIGPSFPKTNKR